MHELLQLVKGVPKAVGDSSSLEQGISVIDLMSDTGFMLDPAGGWSPQIAGTDGVWAENPLAVGRVLMGGDDGNVVETMKLSIGGDRIYAHMTALNRFIQDARLFWTSDYQIEPVYIKWKAVGAPAAQYALIYTVTVAFDAPSAVDTPGPVDVVLTIEREPYWRAIPPGVNPKVYWFEKNGLSYHADTNGTDNDLDLFTDNRHLAHATIQNRAEYSDTNWDTLLSKNYIEISGQDIPGDAPALTLISIEQNTANNDFNRFLIGRNTKPDAPYSYPQSLLLDIGSAAIISSDTTSNAFASDTGGVYNPSASANQRIETDFAGTASMRSRFTWSFLVNNNRAVNLYRGRYACFARCRQVGGSAGQIRMHLSAGPSPEFPNVTPDVSPTVQAGTGDTTNWPVTYMGVLTIPPQGRAHTVDVNTIRGTGLTNDAIYVTLHAERTTGSGELYFCDVLLLPLDEPSVSLETSYDIPDATGLDLIVLDNSGYLSHGDMDDYAWMIDLNGNYSGAPEISGQSITLVPGVDNRLYFYGLDVDNLSSTQKNFEVRVDIVPRWRSVRDAI